MKELLADLFQLFVFWAFVTGINWATGIDEKILGKRE